MAKGQSYSRTVSCKKYGGIEHLKLFPECWRNIVFNKLSLKIIVIYLAYPEPKKSNILLK